jgi:hypothetical protein
MKSGMRHTVSAAAGVLAAAAITVLLVGGEYEASLTQAWAASQELRGPGPLIVSGPVSSLRGAALIAAAAAIAGALCGWRRLSPAAPLLAGLPLAGLGLLSWLDTWRMTLLATGSLAQPWSRLVTDQVFLVTGCILLLASATPARWRRPPGPARPSRHWAAVAVALGLLAMPVVWYLVQLTNMTPANYPASYWWPFQQNADDSVDVLFVLVIATLGLLAASRSLRITAIIAGAPMLALGLLGLLAPGLAASLVTAAGFGPAWHYAIVLDLTSGLPLLYGGILVTAGLVPARSARLAAVARRRDTAPPVAVS